VGAEIKNIPGIMRVEFDQETRVFRVEFHQRFVSPEDILNAVWQAGKKMGQEYIPQVIS
jgi:copper chaperone CopZ